MKSRPDMTANDDKAKKGEILRALINFIFGFKNKKGQILGHWISFADGFSLSSQEFYSMVAKQLQERKIPNMDTSHVEFAEGGLLSDKRTYLRFMRERLAFDTCAAPFGNLYFFSCRTVYVPALVRLWHILAAVLFFVIVFNLPVKPLGFISAVIAVSALPFALAGVLSNAASCNVSNLDRFLLKIPVVSTIYEDWFREETYHREDTRMVYLNVLPSIIKELAEDICATKGVKLQQQFQRAPILMDLYKPVSPKEKPRVE